MPYLIELPNLAGAPSPRHLDILDGKTTAVQRALRREGLAKWEPVLQATLLALCETAPDRVVFYDVGAHVGLYCALVSALFETSVCLAFEPAPDTLKIARKLRDANALPYHIVPRAVSDAAGEVTLYLSPTAETSNSLNPNFRPGSTAITARSVTIDSYLRYGGPIPTLVKIDVETNEPAVLRGARRTIARHRPNILCELLRKVDSATLLAELEWMQGEGYHFHELAETADLAEFTAAEVVTRCHAGRAPDWLFTPGLDAGFANLVGTTLRRINACGKETNQKPLAALPAMAR